MLEFIIFMGILALFGIIIVGMDKKPSLTIAIIGIIAVAFFTYAAIASESYIMLIVPAGGLVMCLAGVVVDIYNKIQDKKEKYKKELEEQKKNKEFLENKENK